VKKNKFMHDSLWFIVELLSLIFIIFSVFLKREDAYLRFLNANENCEE
jgi:hypothetical protein